MKSNNLIKRFFGNWKYPILFFASTLFLLVLSGAESTHSHFFQNSSGILLGFGVLTLVISSIVQFVQKKWKRGIATIAIGLGGIIIGCILFLIIATAVPMIDGDHWADDLKIPPNISLNNPIDMYDYNRRKVIKNQNDLVLYNSSQPGMYEYDFWTGKIEQGTIHLRAYEITEDEEYQRKV